VGKTTFVRKISGKAGLIQCVEEHDSRPFQALFAQNKLEHGFANQIDYLLFRTEQELRARKEAGISLQDGGLEEDFFVFTKLFFKKGYLSKEEFALCKRLYEMARSTLPPPDLMIYMVAPMETIIERRKSRQRSLDIVGPEDLLLIEGLISEFLVEHRPQNLLEFDASKETPEYEGAIKLVTEKIMA
jgi:deoxyadenosine/deoxycytidine kinase